MEKVYLNPDGTFPWSGGKPNLITQDEFEECCCKPPAPCECPCSGTWPPTTWPCGGLLEEYSLNYFFAERYALKPGDPSGSPLSLFREYRLESECILSAHPSLSCRWVSSACDFSRREFDFSTNTWGAWATVSASVILKLRTFPASECAWVLETTFSGEGNLSSAEKATGSNPVGSYYGVVNVVFSGNLTSTMATWATIS